VNCQVRTEGMSKGVWYIRVGGFRIEKGEGGGLKDRRVAVSMESEEVT